MNEIAANWLEQQQAYPRLNLALLADVCRFVSEVPDTTKTVPFCASAIKQGLAMADELRALNCDTETLAAGILFPTLYYSLAPLTTIEQSLPPEVITLAKGVQKMDAIQQITQERSGSRADNLRKMCLAMVDDVRIVLIKLTEQLVILKNVKTAQPDEQKQDCSTNKSYLCAFGKSFRGWPNEMANGGLGFSLSESAILSRNFTSTENAAPRS